MLLYDPSYQNCRTPLLDLINNESTGIDVGMWFMEDLRFSAALIKAHKRGVRVRVIMNLRTGIPSQTAPLEAMKAAGIPMRCSKSYFHTKAMIFAAQQTLEIGGANFTSNAFVPEIPFVNYTDEIIAFLTEPCYVRAAMQEFDDAWTNAFDYDDFGNAPNEKLRRAHAFGFGKGDTFLTEFDFVQRLVTLIQMETVGIFICVYRMTNSVVWHELHLARERGVPIWLITEPNSYYRWNEQAYLQPWNMVQGIYYLHALGGQIKFRQHAGLMHEKFGLFHSSRRLLFGSQNWNVYEGGREWNVDVYGNDEAFAWGVEHFARKWNSEEFAPITNVLSL
jgi:phosphatidylserine/phosphatidylglycerophosphate/cardiolipin synthase-like enzyme